jgi:hypothetical protein
MGSKVNADWLNFPPCRAHTVHAYLLHAGDKVFELGEAVFAARPRLIVCESVDESNSGVDVGEKIRLNVAENKLACFLWFE